MNLSVPSPRAVGAWFVSLAEEVVRAPATLRDARIAIGDLGRIPEQLELFAVTLEKTAGALDIALVELSGAVAGRMHETLEHLDGSVSELRDTLTGVIGVIPGARRALQGAARPPHRPS